MKKKMYIKENVIKNVENSDISFTYSHLILFNHSFVWLWLNHVKQANSDNFTGKKCHCFEN